MTSASNRGSLISKIGSYLQIVTKDPCSTAFVPLAEAYRQIGLLDDALEAARLGTKMLPHFSPGFSTLGRVLGQMGRIDEAMSAYAKALSIDRQSQAGLIGLARLHLIRSERDQARKILHQASEFHPDDANVADMLVALDLPRPWAEIKQASALQQQEDEADAVKSESSEPIPTATLAEIYVKQGLLDKARKIFQEILTQNPDNHAVRERMQQLSEQAVSRTEALPAEPLPSAGAEEASRDLVDEKETAGSDQSAVDSGQHKTERQQEPILTVLQRWLNAITNGRANVQ